MSVDILTVTLNPAIDWTVSVAEFSIGEVNRAGSEMTGAGGKGVNVAAVLADYGLSVAATGFLGRENDEPFRQLFARRGIEDRMIRLDGPTRTGIKIVDGACGGTTDINFPGLSPSISDLRALSGEIQSVPARWFVLGGSLPPGVHSEIYRDFVTQCRAMGSQVALDTSGEAMKAALCGPRDSLPHLIKPNLAELEELVGEELKSSSAILEAARALVAQGIEQVAVSLGKDGLLLATPTESVWARPPSIQIGTTVGAGDALLAGLIAAACEDRGLTERARTATAFAAEVLTRNGKYGISKRSVASWERQIPTQPALPVRGSPSQVTESALRVPATLKGATPHSSFVETTV